MDGEGLVPGNTQGPVVPGPEDNEHGGTGVWFQPPSPHSLFVIQCSAGRSRFLRRPCSTERTEGRWTSCSTKRWDCRERAEARSLPRGPHACHLGLYRPRPPPSPQRLSVGKGPTSLVMPC